MSLLDECLALEPGYNGITNWTVLDEIEDVEEVSNEYTGEGRWETYHMAVFKRETKTLVRETDDREDFNVSVEYVALEYSEPATEMQEGQDQSLAEFYEVRPVQVTVTKYEKV